MKKYLVSLMALLALTGLVLLAADIDGTWTAETQGKNGPQTQTLTLISKGGVLTGKLTTAAAVVRWILPTARLTAATYRSRSCANARRQASAGVQGHTRGRRTDATTQGAAVPRTSLSRRSKSRFTRLAGPLRGTGGFSL